jgi:hypothetical protein
VLFRSIVHFLETCQATGKPAQQNPLTFARPEANDRIQSAFIPSRNTLPATRHKLTQYDNSALPW